MDTMEKLFNYAAYKNGGRKALGTREILAEEDELQPDGTLFKKVFFDCVFLKLLYTHFILFFK